MSLFRALLDKESSFNRSLILDFVFMIEMKCCSALLINVFESLV